jgi:hypothetical protein
MKTGDKIVIGGFIAIIIVCAYIYNPTIETFIGYCIDNGGGKMIPERTGNYYLFSTYKYSGLHKTGHYWGILGHVFRTSPGGYTVREIDKEFTDAELYMDSLSPRSSKSDTRK